MKVNAGYFIETAKYVLLEHYHDIRKDQKRHIHPTEDDDTEKQAEPDAGRQLADFEYQQKRISINDCLLECLEELESDHQDLLYSYSYRDDLDLDVEEDDPYKGFLGNMLSSILEIGRKLKTLENTPLPSKGSKRLTVHRLRVKLKECFVDCMDRKKGLA